MPTNFTNDGTFTVSSAFAANGALLNAGGSFANTGVFSVTTAGANAIATGLDMGLTGPVSNSGSISATGSSAYAVHFGSWGDVSLNNTGSITSTSTSSRQSVAIQLFGSLYYRGSDGIKTITNSGTITGDEAIAIGDGSIGGIGSDGDAILNLTNSGTINGEIILGTGTGSPIHNNGVINGAIHLSATGNDLYDGHDGVQMGGIFLGGGVNTVSLGNDGETVYGGAGNATVTSGSGADTFVATAGQGHDTVINFSDAQGDKIDLSAFSAFSSMAAVQAAAIQSGSDTVIAVGSGSITLQNVQLSSLTAGDFVLHAEGIYPATQARGDYVVGPGQTSIFTGTPLSSAYQLSDAPTGGSSNAYNTTSFTDYGSILVQSDLPDVGLMAFATAGAGGTVAVHIAAGGSLTVAESGSEGYTFGAFLSLPASFTNDGTISISSDSDAAGIEASGLKFLNTGTININSQTGVAEGVFSNFGPASWPASAVNSGSITVYGGFFADGLVFETFSGQTFTNSGKITVTSGAVLATGVQLGDRNPGTETLINSGVITATAAIRTGGSDSELLITNTGTINGAIRLDQGPGSTVHNQGVINGDVHLTPTGADLYDGRGGTLAGAIYLGGGLDTVFLGNDSETVYGGMGGGAITGGSGADNLTISTLASGSYSITLGTGSDALTLSSTSGQFQAANLITVTDFQAGAGGDRLDIAAYLDSALQGYTAGSDPITSGYLRLYQSGSDTLVQIDQNGGGDSFQTLMTLKGVNPFALTAANFDGLVPVGSPISTTVTAPAGGGTLTVGSGAEALVGAAGGVNTAVFSGASRSYGLSVNGGAGLIDGGPEGASDTLSNIQRLQFVDGYIATSPTDTAGQVYRIYEATLGRAPDQVGMANWVHLLNSGQDSLQQVVAGFTGSQEFITNYGALSNSDFVTLLYTNVLHRQPDAQGLANWVGLLNSGTDTRSQVVLGFSESQEDIADLAAPVQARLFILDPGAAQVARLYDTTFGRLPDASGLANWTHLLDNGTDTLLQIAQGFTGSQEFQSVYGNLGNSDFVTDLYLNTLHRQPDQSGLANWVALLANGTDTRAQVVLGFSESVEHINKTAAHIDNGVWLA